MNDISLDKLTEKVLIACNLVEDDPNITLRVQAADWIAELLSCSKTDAMTYLSWYTQYVYQDSKFVRNQSA